MSSHFRVPYSLTVPRRLTEDTYREIRAGNLEIMNMGRKFWRARMETLTPEQLAVVKPYIAQMYEFISEGQGLFIWGKNSTGKSYLASLLCKEAYRRCDAKAYCVTAASLRESFIHSDYPAYEDLDCASDSDGTTMADRVRDIRFLVIDDLGKEYRGASGFSETQLGVLLRHRIRNGLTTCITANRHPRDLVEGYSISTIELIKESMYPVRLEGMNMREEAASRLTEAYKKAGKADEEN